MKISMLFLAASFLILLGLTSSPSQAQTDYDGVSCSNASDSMTCMVCTLYFESRGESNSGKMAVGQVVMTRIYSDLYYDRVCDNIYHPYAFSWTSDGKSDTLPRPGHSEYKALLESIDMAERAYYSGPNGYTHFHADYVSPSWSKHPDCLRKPPRQIGVHIFYDCGRGDYAVNLWRQQNPLEPPTPMPRPAHLYE